MFSEMVKKLSEILSEFIDNAISTFLHASTMLEALNFTQAN